MAEKLKCEMLNGHFLDDDLFCPCEPTEINGVIVHKKASLSHFLNKADPVFTYFQEDPEAKKNERIV